MKSAGFSADMLFQPKIISIFETVRETAETHNRLHSRWSGNLCVSRFWFGKMSDFRILLIKLLSLSFIDSSFNYSWRFSYYAEEDPKQSTYSYDYMIFLISGFLLKERERLNWLNPSYFCSSALWQRKNEPNFPVFHKLLYLFSIS